MIRTVYIFLGMVVAFWHTSHAESLTSRVSGNAPGYSGTELVFMRYSNMITMNEEVMARERVDENGHFDLELPLWGTEYVFLHLGIYQAYFFAEPGMSYELVLPEPVAKTAREMLNPYFEPVGQHLGLGNFNKDELNVRIMRFDDAYNPLYNKHVTDIYVRPDISLLEKDIQQLESPYPPDDGSFFGNYRKYRYGLLKLLASQERVQSLSDEYFDGMPVLYDNPAYAELFNKVYDKYFIFFGRTEQGKKIYNDINLHGSYDSLLNTFSRNLNFSNDTLAEIVILKQLHDEYYGDQFSRKGLLNVLDSLIKRTTIVEHRRIGQEIRNKITRLQTGFEPPPFELEDTEGNVVRLSDFLGKYLYLNFCTCQSYTCLNEFNMLSQLHKRGVNNLVILTVTIDPNDEDLKQFRARNHYDWVFLLYDRQPEILREYDIRAFPTYFLIGPDGRLIDSPAPSPAENIENRLFEVMRSRGDL